MKVFTTSSGLVVLFRHIDSATVDMRYYIARGSFDEVGPDEHGRFHALEHAMFSGTEKRNWLDIVRGWESIGAYSNAFTWQDRTIYQTSCMKRDWKEAYEILADTLYNCRFPEDRWEEVEKGAIISEIQSSEDNEVEVLTEALYTSALGDSYHPILGTVAGIKKTRVSDLKSLYDQHYRKGNVYLLVTGDLEEDRLLRAVERYDRLKGPDASPRKCRDLDFNYNNILRFRPIEQSLIEILKPIPLPRTLRTEAALEIGISCLEGYLFEQLRELYGLCYGVKPVLYWDIPGHLFLGISTATTLEKLERTKKQLLASLDNFLKEGLTSERIHNTKAFETFAAAVASEDFQSSAGWMWDAYLAQVYSDPFKAYPGIIKGLDNWAIKKVLKRALEGNIKMGICSHKER